MVEADREISLADAVRLFEAVPHAVLPATLHPLYGVGDARRSAALKPQFLSYEAGGERWLHGLHTTRIDGTTWRDASSPYGYGGPVATTSDTSFTAAAWRAYEAWMHEHRVVVEYLRFHPLLGNHAGYPGDVSPGRAVVSVDLSNADFAQLYPARLQQVLRKAERSGLVYEEHAFAPFAPRLGEFHRAAMRAMQADDFY